MYASTQSSMLASPLPPFVLGTYSLPISSLGCEALCIDIIFLVLWTIYIYDLVWLGFYGISTIIGYFMPDPHDTYKLNIYDLVWLTFMAYQPLLVISCQILLIHIN